MTQGMPDFAAGDVVSARALNQMAREIERLGRELERLKGLAAQGVKARVIELARVISRTGGGAPGAPVLASAVNYTVRPLGAEPASDVGPRAPDYGRCVTGPDVQIIPAEAGDPAVIIRMPDGSGGWESLIMVQERLATENCE